ncbi:MAG: PorT family protein [Bacteroidetes bacterium]|nr:PorT family protein [Bacteroidota bacterium]
MKKLILLALTGALLSTTQAQIKFGVKAGVNLATLTGDISNAKMLTGFNAGGLVEVNLGKMFAVQPEVLYSSQGAKSSFEGQDFNMNLGYLNVPVLFKYKHPSGFFAATGPQIGFLLSAQEKAGSDHVDIKSSFKSTDFSWAFGVGYMLKPINVGVEARFNQGLSNIASNSDQQTTGTGHNQVIQVGLVYMFGGL